MFRSLRPLNRGTVFVVLPKPWCSRATKRESWCAWSDTEEPCVLWNTLQKTFPSPQQKESRFDSVMSTRRNSGSHSRVLLVEGADDRWVIERLLDRSDCTRSFDILQADGVDRLLKRIRLEVRIPHREVVGVVVDSDGDIEARWESIRSQFARGGIELPAERNHQGVIIDSEPRIGVWLMPDNVSSGQLEDFVQSMIPQDDQVWPLADSFVDSIPLELREFPPNKITRAKLYSWLATRKEPGPMSRAIQAMYLDIHTKKAQSFLHFLTALFGESIEDPRQDTD